MRNRSKKISLLLVVVLLCSCDAFLSNDSNNKNNKEDWKGRYGGATDVYSAEGGVYQQELENKEVVMEIRFEEESDEIDYFEFEVNYYTGDIVPPHQESPNAPTKISSDSLILVDREGKYQTDYLIERNGQDINGEVRIFEKDSDGEYMVKGLYEFSASQTEP